MEYVLAIVIVCLAAGGLALGLALGRGPVKGSCGGAACIPGAACLGCTRRRPAEEDAP